MFKPTISFSFFCAAVFLFSGEGLFAEKITADTTIFNLGTNSPDYEIVGNNLKSTTLSLRQSVDGTYSGKIVLGGAEGTGILKKLGAGNLTFGGELSCENGYFDLQEGIFTIGNGARFTTSALEILNSGTLVFDQSGDFSAELLHVRGATKTGSSELAGTLESVGSGSALVGSASGESLNVRSGKLAFVGSVNFNEITIGKGAELCIGNGNASANLEGKGTITILEGGVLSFNRVSSSENPMNTFSGTIAGTGGIRMDGDAPVYLSGAQHSYTGETIVNAGTLFFVNEKQQVALATKKVTLNGGWFGGNARIAGDVEVRGKYIPLDLPSGTTPPLGGGLYLAGAGTKLSIAGNLTIAPAEIELVNPSSGNPYYRISNYGGTLQAHFSQGGTCLAEVAGTTNLGGRLLLSADKNVAPGSVQVFLRAQGELKGNFDFIDSTDNAILVSPGVAGIRENELGIGVVESKILRERSGFSEHKNIGEFVDYLADSMRSASPIEAAQAVALAAPSDITNTVNNFSALGYSALPGMGVRQSRLETDYLRRAFLPGLRSPSSPDGVSIAPNVQYFSSLMIENVENYASEKSPIYDFTSFGILTGAYSWIDDERIAGFSLGLHRGEAKTHGARRGALWDNAARLRAFLGFLPKHTTWTLLVGGDFAGHYYDLDRETALGMNSAHEFGMEAGLFAEWSLREEIAEDVFFTPYAGIDFNYVRTDTIREKGTAAALNVDAFGYASYQCRFGIGLERKIYKPKGGILTLGFDFGLALELGKDPKISSEFVKYGDFSRTSIRGNVEDRYNLELAPKMNYEISENLSFDLVYRLGLSSEGSVSNAISFGLRTTF